MNNEEIDAALKHNHEFNARFQDWLKSNSTVDATSSTKVVEDTLSFQNLGVAFSKSLNPSVITISSHSTSSLQSTIKRREAYAKMKLLQSEAAQEDDKRKRREMRRKLDLTALELNLWDSDFCDNEFPKTKHDKTNTSSVSSESIPVSECTVILKGANCFEHRFDHFRSDNGLYCCNHTRSIKPRA